MELITKYKKAHNKLILLDYDGTLVDFTIKPDDAKPSGRLLKVLSKITSNPSAKTVIITGREYRSIDKLVGHLPIDIVAEHGTMMKQGGIWNVLIKNSVLWKYEVMAVLKQFTAECRGSFIEEKRFSIAWHYRNSESEAGYACSRKLIGLLDNNIHAYMLKILDGNKVVEILNNDIGKGKAVNKLIEQKNYDCILAVGDDKTDEEMFAVLKDNGNSITIKVGDGTTCAQFRLNTHENVLQLLELL